MKTIIAHKKNIDSKKTVHYKFEDATTVSLSTGRKGTDNVFTEFDLYINTDNTKYSITFSREDAEKIVRCYSEQLLKTDLI